MDDYRLTVIIQTALRDSRDLKAASVRLLDALVETAEDLGPITTANLQQMTISATVAYDAGGLDLDAGVRRGIDVIAPAIAKAEIGSTEIIDAHLTRIADRELQTA